MASELEITLSILGDQIYHRLVELILAPINQPDMLWTAIPLLAATFFMTLYFGRYKREELGWNTAFGNTTVFMFVALDILREMYSQGGDSFGGLISGNLYTILTLGLIGGSFILMFMTYFHLLPKGFAFFLFSAPPINMSVYLIMAIVYANVAPDEITILAGITFLIVILIISKILKVLIGLIGLEYVPRLEDVQLPEDFVKRFREVEVTETPKEEITIPQEMKKPKKTKKV